jgi:pimeloyl-ACP methyl ester carboxylesterase
MESGRRGLSTWPDRSASGERLPRDRLHNGRPVVNEHDLDLPDGRRLHIYDTGGGNVNAGLAIFWHHGTPNLGEPPEPLLAPAARRGIRWVSHDRPGYGASTPQPGRHVASAAADVSAIADAVGIRRFAVMGHSGGGPHALACSALLADRVIGTVSVSGLAPYRAEGMDWFAGMGTAGAAELRAAAVGRSALAAYLASSEFDPEMFTPADHVALKGAWSWLGKIAGRAMDGGPGGMIDDDRAYVAPWGFDPGQVTPPVLVVQGGQDRIAPASHGRWLASHLPSAELWLRPEDGHVSVLTSAEAAIDWLLEQAGIG